MRLAHRLAAGTALGVLALTSITACSGSEGAAGNSEADDDGDGEATPAEVLGYAKSLLDSTTGVELTLATDDDPDTDAFLKSAEGVITTQPAFEGTAAARVAGISASDIGVNSVDGLFQIDLPVVGWTEYDPAELCAPDPAALLDPDTGVSSVLTGAEDLEVGDTERGGPDNSEVLTAFTGTVPGDTVTNILPCAPGDSFDARFTINEDGYLRAAEVTGEFFSGSGDITYTIDLEKYDVDQEITVPEDGVQPDDES